MILGKYTILLAERKCIMGILNVTPDSFSDGGEYFDLERAVCRAKNMVDEGADIIDIGGESSRPGSQYLSASEEKKRVMPVIEALSSEINVPISIDTHKSEVARAALSSGAVIVNDITALKGDEKMAEVVAEHDAGLVLMHMQGTPENMQKEPFYVTVMDDIISYLDIAVKSAISSGVDPEKIIVDPGIGFGKTLEGNLTILRELSKLKKLNKPVLIGTSRKSFIGALTGKAVKKRSFGTAASTALAIINGADIVRVHDVDEIKDVVNVTEAIVNA